MLTTWIGVLRRGGFSSPEVFESLAFITMASGIAARMASRRRSQASGDGTAKT
jgi:hypothetical protein